MKSQIIILFFFNICFGQLDLSQEIVSLKDSILFYKDISPDKAINFGFEVLKIADYSSPDLNLVSINSLIGQILTERNHDAEAIRFFSDALRLFETVPIKDRIEKEINFPAWVLVNIGNIYYKNKNFLKAEEKYLQALENFKLYKNITNQRIGICAVNDNLALIAFQKQEFELVESYYQESYSIRKQTNRLDDILYSNLGFLRLNLKRDNLFIINSVISEIEGIYIKGKGFLAEDELKTSNLNRNYAYSFSMMGEYYKKKKKFKVALDFFNKSKNLLEKFPAEWPRINASIAECYLGLNELNTAIKTAEENLFKIKNSFYISEKKRNFKVLEKVFENQNDNQNLLRIKDSLIAFSSLANFTIIGNKFNKLESDILLSKNRSELNESKIRYNTYLFILIIGSIILFFSLISIRLNYNLEREKSKKIFNEKIIVEKDLNHKKVELLNKSNFIAERNKSLNYLLETVDNPNNTKTFSSDDIKQKIKVILKHENRNDRFEKHFEDVYPGFFKSLIAISKSNLTQNDLRLCAYLKMNQGTDEISQLTGVSVRTVESKKYRLKKKLSFNKDQSLITFIHGF